MSMAVETREQTENEVSGEGFVFGPPRARNVFARKAVV